MAALPAEQQVEAITQRLKELNRRFDGRVEPTIRDGVVVALTFNTDGTSDLSPVRALTQLESLDCSGSASAGGWSRTCRPCVGCR